MTSSLFAHPVKSSFMQTALKSSTIRQ